MTTTPAPHTPPGPRSPRRRPAWARVGADRGSVTVEAILAVSGLLLALGVIVDLGRLQASRQSLDAAAHDAARAASLQRAAGPARQAGIQSATDSIRQGGTSCRRLAVAVDTARFVPGGSVTVRLSCAVALTPLGSAIPTMVTVSASAVSPIDLYRTTT